MKNKKSLFIIGVVVLLAVIIVFVLNKSSEKSSKNISLSKISKLSIDKGVKCKNFMNATGDAGISKGEMYFYKDMYRYDTVIDHEEMGSKSMHVINKDGKNYIWGDIMQLPGMAENVGYVVDVDEESDSELPFDIKELEDLKVSNFEVPGIDCEKWNVDMTKFDTSKMEFKTMEELFSPENFNFQIPMN